MPPLIRAGRWLALLLALASAPALADGPVGFAALNGGTTGGAGGPTITVNTGAQLLEALKRSGPVTIRVNGTITPANTGAQEIGIQSRNDVTIIGADLGGELNGIGIRISGGSSNVIIRNLIIHHVAAGPKDGIGVEGPSRRIWIDHNELYDTLSVDKDFYDGLVDTKRGAEGITISYNYFHDHHKALLNGYSDSDVGNRNITFAFNHFARLGSRTPSVRFGKAEVVGNYLHDISVSGVNSRMGACLEVHGNVFENVQNPITSLDSKTKGIWTSRDNLADGKPLPETGTGCGLPYPLIAANSACIKAEVLRTAGVGTGLATVDASCSPPPDPAPGPTPSPAPIPNPAPDPDARGTGDFPDGYSKCADQGETCTVKRGSGRAAFGAKPTGKPLNYRWVFRDVPVGSSIPCTVTAFGVDPAPGTPKKCSFKQ